MKRAVKVASPTSVQFSSGVDSPGRNGAQRLEGCRAGKREIGCKPQEQRTAPDPEEPRERCCAPSCAPWTPTSAESGPVSPLVGQSGPAS